jgi:ABC-type lipoprotein release transport system permease subunit
VIIASLWLLIRRDLGRARGALVTSGFGIAAGTAALVFFLALGLGVRQVLLGDVFPIDKVELQPQKASDPGLLGLLTGDSKPPGIETAKIERFRADPAVEGVYPKLRFSFPSSARGGKELLGRDVGTSEMIGDGIDPALVRADAMGGLTFEDPLKNPGPPCKSWDDCKHPQYCEKPSGEEQGVCSDPVPVLASRYLVEVFDKSIAPAHHLPPIGETLVDRAQIVVFRLWLGESLLGKSKSGAPRHVNARLVGISPRAIDIGITIPLDVVRRWNREYTGPDSAEAYSSVLVDVRDNDQVSHVIALGAELGLEPKDTRARDVSVLITSVMALLGLVAGIILFVSASNIAYTFRVLVNDRRSEIALYRALGASARDMVVWLMALALVVGVSAGALGTVVARLVALGADHLAATRLPDFPFKPQTFFSFPPLLLVGALGFGALFALLGAFGPARRAGRVDPAAALAAV